MSMKKEQRVLVDLDEVTQMIIDVGGTDASDEYSKGWDEAIATCLESLSDVSVVCVNEKILKEKNFEKFIDEIASSLYNYSNITSTLSFSFYEIPNDIKFDNENFPTPNHIKEFLLMDYVEQYKLTRFELDLLLSCIDREANFKYYFHLVKMKHRGYFKCIDDTSMPINEILKKAVIRGKKE